MAILGNPKQGDIIGFNVTVNDDDDGGDAERQISWCGQPHKPVTYGNLLLGPPSYSAPKVASPMADQTGTFTVEFDATPTLVPIDSVMALSAGAGTAFSSFGCLARFYQGDSNTTPPTAPRIDARNGSGYAADNVIPYSANVTYHFRMVVNIPAHTYSVYVTLAGGTELTVGSNYAFRTEQNTVTHLDHWGVIVDVAAGTNTVCNFSVH